MRSISDFTSYLGELWSYLLEKVFHGFFYDHVSLWDLYFRQSWKRYRFIHIPTHFISIGLQASTVMLVDFINKWTSILYFCNFNLKKQFPNESSVWGCTAFLMLKTRMLRTQSVYAKDSDLSTTFFPSELIFVTLNTFGCIHTRIHMILYFYIKICTNDSRIRNHAHCAFLLTNEIRYIFTLKKYISEDAEKTKRFWHCRYLHFF